MGRLAAAAVPSVTLPSPVKWTGGRSHTPARPHTAQHTQGPQEPRQRRRPTQRQRRRLCALPTSTAPGGGSTGVQRRPSLERTCRGSAAHSTESESRVGGARSANMRGDLSPRPGPPTAHRSHSSAKLPPHRPAPTRAAGRVGGAGGQGPPTNSSAILMEAPRNSAQCAASFAPPVALTALDTTTAAALYDGDVNTRDMASCSVWAVRSDSATRSPMPMSTTRNELSS
jgi:hypothetical protein